MLARCLLRTTSGSYGLSSHILARELFSFKRNMSSNLTKGVSLKEMVETLNTFADVSLAESWDNVGLLIEPTVPKNIERVMLTNDLTEKVMQDAIDYSINLIISYHPPIFVGLKRITTKTWKERIAAQCLENKIAVYSPHTSFDSIKGGVNDWLIGGFDIESSRPIEPSANPENGMGRICQLKTPILLEEAVKIVKIRTGLHFLRMASALNKEKPIKTIAACAGSGASVLKNVPADLYLTGEMLHHDILDAVHRNIHVILTDHSNSERGYLRVFAETLSKLLDGRVHVICSCYDADPLKIV